MTFAGFFYSNENNILALIIFVLFGVFVFLKRKKFDVEGKVIFIYRTKLGLKLMKDFSRFRRFINVYSIIGVFAAVISIGYFLYLSIPYLGLMMANPSSTLPAADLVLPVSGVPGVIGVPILYWLIALLIVVVLHEGSHGVVALARKIKLKSSGFGFFLGILPLAFVEPDEKVFSRARRIDRLKVLSAGSFTNVVMGVIFLLLYLWLSHYLVASGAISFTPYLLHIVNVSSNGPAQAAGLPANTTILKIDGSEVFQPAQLYSYLNVRPGTLVNFTSTSGTVYSIRTAYNSSITSNANHSYVGFEGYLSLQSQQPFLISPIASNAYPNNGLASQGEYWLDGLVLWIFIIALGLGIANFLPIFYITDGCKIVYELVGYFTKNVKRQLRITNAIVILFSVFFLLLTPLGSILFSIIR